MISILTLLGVSIVLGIIVVLILNDDDDTGLWRF